MLMHVPTDTGKPRVGITRTGRLCPSTASTGAELVPSRRQISPAKATPWVVISTTRSRPLGELWRANPPGARTRERLSTDLHPS
jgi:hypothetical protein